MIPDYVNGPIAPTFTVFNQDGTLDDEGQRQFLDFLIDNGGISAFFVRSGMGQMFTFSEEDVHQLARNAVAHLKGKAPVLVGAAGIWDRDRSKYPDPAVYTKQAIELSKFAEDLGADGIVHTVPEAIRPQGSETPDDIILKYFETINAAVSCPVFIYQSPGTDENYQVRFELASQLADMEHIAGMKLSSSDAEWILDCCSAVKGKDFGFICGHECAFYAALYAGAKAVIGQGSCIYPSILNAVQTCYEAGDPDGAVAAQRSANLLVQRSSSSTEFFKRYAAEKGYKVQPYAREAHTSGYRTAQGSLSDETYTTYKALLESEIAKFQ